VHAQPVDDETQRSEAERLFVERARSVLPEFVLTERSGRAVADVCRRLDGLPLAIELAAARVKVLSCEQIVQRLEDPFRLLTSVSQRTAPRRQQTLRAVFDWSYGLLNQREQAMFKHLSVFAGGCAVGALESVGADIGIPESEVLDIVSALVDKSLVLAGQQAGGARYRLLETMREYGRNRLVEAGEETAARDRHAAFFLTLVAQAEPHLGVHSHDQGVWIAELERERENLRAVLHWVVDHDDAAAALRMGAALWPFWLNRGYLSEGAAWLEAILAVSAGTLSAERSTVLLGASSLASARGDYAQVVAYATERLALEREIGDPLGEASALNSLGLAALNQGDLEGARAHVAEGLAIRRDEGDEHGVCASLNNLGMVATYANDLETAVALLGEAVAMDRRWGYDPDTAIPLLHLGEAVLALGDHRRARACLTESLSIFTQIGNRLRTMSCLEAFAGVASKQSDPERAARLLGAADALHEVMGASQAPMARTRKDNLVAAVRSALGGDAYAECWAAGRAMSLEQGVAHALEPDGRAH
jgi:non-specific serine/threonine protein kinase